MKGRGRMQKIPMSSDSRPQKDSTECESYEGVQTFMDMAENNLKEVQFERGNLLEFILSPDNLNRAYLQVKRNHGSVGVDGLSTEELGGYLKEHKDELIASLQSGSYRPNPVRPSAVWKYRRKTARNVHLASRPLWTG